MTSEIEIYYYLKRIDADLQDELKPKLKGYINLDSHLANLNVTLSSNPKVGIIHASQRHTPEFINKVSNINFNLIIFISQGAGRPTEATKKYQEQFPNVIIWDGGTEYLIDHFAELEKYLTENQNNWKIEGWTATEFQKLSALTILCQGYLVIYAGWSELSETIVDEIRKDMNRKKERVSEASWWLDGLALWDEENQKINREKWEKFERDIAQEWENQSHEQIPDALIQLLNAIKETPTKLKQPQLVAEAYQSYQIRLHRNN
ncbi:hypothetical protein [Microseira sp. BLCC-F43]|jgi:hypothetical protein|uniref:hypothetical protein n=1 Tax=Microseira sp. BLCC-F43 TaxID=3153602 RepID=UPI0035B9F50E